MTDRAPERIWLEHDPVEVATAILSSAWCVKPVSGRPVVEYVRADLAPSPPALSGECGRVVKELRERSVIYSIPSLNEAASLLEAHERETFAVKAKADEDFRVATERARTIEAQAREIAELKAGKDRLLKLPARCPGCNCNWKLSPPANHDDLVLNEDGNASFEKTNGYRCINCKREYRLQ